MSELINGLILAHTECPYKNECEIAQANQCFHRGTEHEVNFSCAIARSFEIIKHEDN